ncbi:MAG TPA: tail protein X [Candidatus Lachnoclostridium avicola]|nr:tail protein X [Candidatus Lachnoclostridium avicola]
MRRGGRTVKEYRTIQGDTWDWIAKKVYGNEKRLDVLMENNQDLLDILIFPAGVTLQIPEELPESAEDVPAWRK